MSAFLDKADAMATQLRTIPALDGIAVIVDRQKNLKDQLAMSLAKKKGAAIVIFWTGFSPREKDSDSLFITSNFSVTVWGKPIITKGDISSDEIVVEVLKALNGWSEDERCLDKLYAQSGKLVTNPTYVIYELPFSGDLII